VIKGEMREDRDQQLVDVRDPACLFGRLLQTEKSLSTSSATVAAPASVSSSTSWTQPPQLPPETPRLTSSHASAVDASPRLDTFTWDVSDHLGDMA
jgi:hypothetical protein